MGSVFRVNTGRPVEVQIVLWRGAHRRLPASSSDRPTTGIFQQRVTSSHFDLLLFCVNLEFDCLEFFLCEAVSLRASCRIIFVRVECACLLMGHPEVPLDICGHKKKQMHSVRTRAITM